MADVRNMKENGIVRDTGDARLICLAAQRTVSSFTCSSVPEIVTSVD